MARKRTYSETEKALGVDEQNLRPQFITAIIRRTHEIIDRALDQGGVKVARLLSELPADHRRVAQRYLDEARRED